MAERIQRSSAAHAHAAAAASVAVAYSAWSWSYSVECTSRFFTSSTPDSHLGSRINPGKGRGRHLQVFVGLGSFRGAGAIGDF